MRYSLLAPGKRLRPYLTCRCCCLAGGDEASAYPVAAAVECVHAFSLIHDDLPAMDDDDVRRGQPACHVRFGEATAILAGDALLALAFELVAGATASQRLAGLLTLELARAVGTAGMIGGQAEDLAGEQHPPDQALTELIHLRKTARLFECACRLGAMLADNEGRAREALGDYGRHLGLAFQATDDLLDATATAEQLGKPTGKDAGRGKQTLVRCVGIEESRRRAAVYVDQAVAALAPFGPQADDLRELARYVLRRAR